MSGSEDILCELSKNYTHSVKLGNDNKLQVAGRGTVKILFDGIYLTLTDVYFVPELRSNLLSLGQLQEKGLKVVFNEGSCRIFHKDRGLVMKSYMKANRMFTMIGEAVKKRSPAVEKVLQTTSTNLSHLWHRRFGHLNYKALETSQKEEMVQGLPQMVTSN